MAAPVYEDTTNYFSATSTSHAVTLPSTIAEGDLLIMNFDALQALLGGIVALTATKPTGWDEIDSYDFDGATFDHAQFIYAKKADGTEGSTATVGLSSSKAAVAQVLRVQAGTWRDTGDLLVDVEVGVEVGADTNTPDPPSISPAGGADDYLIWACTAAAGVTAVTAYPSGYDNNTLTTITNSTTLASATTTVSAATEDPGTFTVSASFGSASTLSQTLAIRAAGDRGGGGLFFGAGF